MQIAVKKTRTNSIDLFRYLCAVLVVVIHSSFWTQWGNFGFFVGEILPRIAVPFFFAISGYFFVQKLEAGEKVFWKQLWHLLTVYALWSFIYLVHDFKDQVLFGAVSPISFFREFVLSFLIFGSQGHFWFFPAIIISTSLVALSYRLRLSKLLLPVSVLLYLIGCLGCSYFSLGTKIPFLNTLFQHSLFTTIRRIFLMGFPFFCSGLLVLKLEKTLTGKKSCFFLWLASAAFFLGEIFLVRYFELAANIVITVGLYSLLTFTVLLLLKYPMPRWAKAAQAARTVANLTYYSHPLFLKLLSGSIFGITLPSLLVFLGTVILCFLLGLLLHILSRKKKLKILQLFVG